jgi:AraC family transcriptional regulator, arabinose operon regulatory protein
MKHEVKSMSYSIYPINAPTSSLPVIVFGIGHEDNQPHVFRKEGFPISQIFICESGEGTLKVNEKIYIIKRGTFFYLAPNTPHEYYGNTDKWEVKWIAFSGNGIEDILAELKFHSTKMGIPGNFNKIQSSFNKIFVTLKSEESSGKFISSSVLYEMLVELYTVLHRKQESETSERNSIVDDVKLYIDKQYNQDITIEELSGFVKVTPQYLCKMFKRHLNLRPFQYIAMKRIQHAKKLLSGTNMSVNDIAHLVGYNDCSYFCAIFKKYEKISPSEFRGLKLE